MFLPILLIYFIYYVSGIQLALNKVEHENNFSLLFDASSSRAFCFPNQTVLGSLTDETNHHNWGYSTSHNYSIAIQRVGQVFCRQLGFPIFKSIMPIEVEESRNNILWAASCLGFEPDISHCLFQESIDHSLICNRFVGLSCHHCNRNIYSLHTLETLTITSPGFPNLYNDGAICEWIVRSNVSLPIVVKIRQLSLPKRNAFGSCSVGFLEIRSKKEDFEPYSILQTVCGESLDMIFVVQGSVLSLRLVSGIFHPRPNIAAGFNLSVSLLEDFTTKEMVKSFLTTEEIIGIVFAVIASLIVIGMLGMLINYYLVRRRQRQRMASTLQKKITPETPFVGFTARKAPLPEILINTENSPLSVSSDGNTKHSLGSRIYEEVNQRSRNCTYLHLENVKKTSVEKEDKPNYSFCVPTILLPPEDDSPGMATSEGSKSQPSDMPSCLSYGSDFDSVFAQSFEAPDLKSTVRNTTYTIISKTNRNATYNIEKNLKEKHLSSPTTFFSKMRTEYLKLRYDSERRSSEPSINFGRVEKMPIIHKTKSLSSDGVN